MAYQRRKKRHIKLSPPAMLGLALVLIAILVFGIATLCINIQLDVAGGTEPLELVYGKDVYTEPSVSASCNGENLEVEVSGSVDSGKVGTYVITYRAQYWWVTKTIEREVRVVDKTAPVITLNKVPGYMTPPGENYVEEGYSATDDYDGDITSRVQIRTENDVIYYSVADSSGNVTIVQREIVRKDEKAPVITLKGEQVISIAAGTAFADPGYTALDNIDGDVTANVTISGSVNIYRADTYTLTYSVTDSSGNVGSAERIVIVTPIQQPPTVNPNGKVIYLTFDDGPGKYTQQLLDVLAKYNAKATFFVVDTGYQTNTLLNNIVNGGHGIGIHTTTHKYDEIYASEEAFFNDLYNMQNVIKKATGVTTTLMRFPGGSSNTISRFNPGIMSRLSQAVTDQGFQYFDWHVDSLDGNPSALTGTKEEKTAQVVANVINGIGNRKQTVVLQHDIHAYSVDAVEEILIWGIQNGYSFQALTPNSPICHHKVNN